MNKPVLKISYNAPVTLTFAILCLATLVLGVVTGGWTTSHLFSVYRSPLSPLAFVRFFGHILGHSGMGHLAGNIGLLLVLGAGLEDRYGSGPLLLAILFTALVSGLIHFMFFPGTALLGASGIVFMMILLSAFGGIRTDTIPLTLILVLILYLGGEVWNALSVRDDVSQMAHIIGGLCGTGIGFWMGRHHKE